MAATADKKKNINKHGRTEVFSAHIHGKNHVYQWCTSYASAFKKSVGNAFFGNLETWISKKFSSMSTMRIPHVDSELRKQ